MKNLSKFLAEHLKKNMDTGKFMDGETYDEAVERILHEGIFIYGKERKYFSSVIDQIDDIRICAALLAVEGDNPYDQKKRSDNEYTGMDNLYLKLV